MPTAGHLPDHLWLTGGRVVSRVEVSLSLLSMLPVDEEHRRRSDAADEVLEARWRRVVREERDPRAERGIRGHVGPLAVSRDVEVFADRTFACALGYNSFESASSRGGFEHHLAADGEADAADPISLDIRAALQEADGGLDVLVPCPAPGIGVAFALAFATAVEQQNAVTVSREHARGFLCALAAREGDDSGAVLRGHVPTLQT